MEKLEKIKLIVIHHSQRKNNNSLIEIKKSHLKRGFEDIGYHYIISKQGNVLKARSEEFQGAHVKGHNQNSLGICLAGNFDLEKEREKQIKSLINLLLIKIKENNLTEKEIKAHNEFPAVTKSCPGKNIKLDELRKIIKQKL